MPTLLELKPKGGLMAKDVETAYEKVRGMFPSYEHADCQTFAAYVVLELTDVKKQNIGVEEDFM